MHSSITELFDLKQKVALVTGGAVGIGAQIAERLCRAGACVAVADCDLERASRTAEQIRSSGSIGKAFACDVGRLEDVRRTVHGVVESFGRIDILVNNAGIFPLAPALDVTETTWDRVLDVNLKGAFFLAQCTAQQMIRQGTGGSIVNIASIDGLHPTGRLVHYDASKAGLIMMTRSLALELGGNRIRVNAVAPGAIQTPGADAALGAMAGQGGATQLKAQFVSRIPLGRMGEPDDIARAVLFLVSRAAEYITGSTLVVDGGFLLS
jgi:2-dehydro-3-deoxy-D-gluconate 5-dehydrogenase